MSRLEKDVREEVITFLNKNRIFHFRIEDPNLANYPDLILCYKGAFVGVELKRNVKTKARQGQLKVLEEIRNSGGIPMVIGSVEDLIAHLEGLDDYFNYEDYVEEAGFWET